MKSPLGNFSLPKCSLFVCSMILTLVLLYGCHGSNSSSSSQEGQYGSIALTLEFEPAFNARQEMPRTAAAAEPDICVDFNVDTIELTVLRPDDQSVATASWDCIEHSGSVEKVPTGTDYTVVCVGMVQGQPRWRGERVQVSVSAGQATRIETLTMLYTGQDTTAPELIYHFPPEGAEQVALNTSMVAMFQEPLALSSISDQLFVVSSEGRSVPGRIEYLPGNLAVLFQPAEPLNPLTTYSVALETNVTDEIGVMDTAGNVCDRDYHWQFTTGNTGDAEGPQVTATLPVAGETRFDPGAPVHVTFNEPLNPAVVAEGIFTLATGQEMVAGKMIYDHQTYTLTFTPDEPLAYLTDYEARLSTGIRDMAENPLSEPGYAWTFRTMEPQYTLTVSKNGTGTGTVTTIPAGIDCGEQCSASFPEGTTIAMVSQGDPNSLFAGWSGPECTPTHCEFSIQGDTSLAVTFDLRTYTINTIANTGGSIRPSGNIVVEYNDGAVFEIEPNQGYYLEDLKIDGVSTTPIEAFIFMMVRQNHTIEAVFKPLKYVNRQAASSGDGLSWSTAYQTLQEAINQSSPGDEIWVSTDTYSLGAPIVVDRPLTFRGGFDTTETYPHQRSQSSRTTIDGNQTVGCMVVTAEAHIENFILNNGTSGNGGGLHCTAPTTVEYCTISNCTADDGGGIYSRQPLNLISCEFTNNRALVGSGGALFILGEENDRVGLTVSDCSFDGNLSLYDLYYEGGLYGGGAIFSNYSDALIISGSSFSQNQAFNGGAVYMVNGGTASIEDCRFENNDAREPAGDGGAIYNKDCLLQISGTLFSDNGGSRGGAIFAHPSDRTSHGVSMISGSEFFNSGSSSGGAAVHIIAGNFRIVNSLFYSNTGLCAGAVCAEDEVSLDVVSSTIVNNHGDIGGIRATSSTSVANSVLWGNTCNTDPNLAQVSAGMAVQHSDIDQDDFDGIDGNIRMAPEFADAPNNDFRLGAGSPCIDKGDNNAAYMPAYDLDGNSRIMGTAVDLGAYERQ